MSKSTRELTWMEIELNAEVERQKRRDAERKAIRDQILRDQAKRDNEKQK